MKKDNKHIIEVNKDDFGALCVCAIRYCHGRQTYMPSLIQEIVIRNIKYITDRDLYTLINDCEFQKEMNLYGSETIDKPDWIRYEKILRDEKVQRGLA